MKSVYCRLFHKKYTSTVEDLSPSFTVTECSKCKARYYRFNSSLIGLDWRIGALYSQSKYFGDYMKELARQNKEKREEKYGITDEEFNERLVEHAKELITKSK